MHLIVLGTSAGGGCPQWNCACPNCLAARQDPSRARTTDSLAFSGSGAYWTIVNPGTDLRAQVARHSELTPRAIPDSVRETGIRSVILTDAEIDHAMGVLNLREGSALNIYATNSVLELLNSNFPLRNVLKKYASIRWIEIIPGQPFVPNAELGEKTVVTAYALSDRQPKYAAIRSSKTDDAVIGLRFENERDGAAVAYAPQLSAWNDRVETLMRDAKIVLVDGTFYTSTELQASGLPAGTSEDMGHMPLSGVDGLLAKLRAFPAEIKLLTHINNTNPILRDNSSERIALQEAGIELAEDGMIFEVGRS